jgi:hypothetical protein
LECLLYLRASSAGHEPACLLQQLHRGQCMGRFSPYSSSSSSRGSSHWPGCPAAAWDADAADLPHLSAADTDSR